MAPSEDEPGYREFFVSPKPGGGVNGARGTVRTVRGPVGIAWSKADSKFRLAPLCSTQHERDNHIACCLARRRYGVRAAIGEGPGSDCGRSRGENPPATIRPL
ncbi:MAG: hypothetical protein FJW20_12700 [Acidimicrobiia bacterium]|nr:hypothetical protein [Acidimicrobiia bacterium]